MRSYNTFANRGRDFEDFVIQVNDLYTRSGKAVVYKVPTEFLPIRDSTGQIKSCKVEHNPALISWPIQQHPRCGGDQADAHRPDRF